MGNKSAIEWTDSTWNPWHGCHKVSAGCKFCYMFRDKERYGQDPNVVVRSKATFRAPLKWKDGRRVFTCSWSDWFIKEADVWRPEAWEIIRATPRHTYQILTKRPERIAAHLPDGWPFANVWLGVSVEDQPTADERIPLLRQTPAALRFISYEPALANLSVGRYLHASCGAPRCWQRWPCSEHTSIGGPQMYDYYPRLDWVIAGGESGPGARPSHPDWFRNVRDQCVAAGVPYFFKQWGEWAPPFSEEIEVLRFQVEAKTPSCLVNPDGRVTDNLVGGAHLMFRVGKKKAGALLDGREWRQFPGASPERLPR